MKNKLLIFLVAVFSLTLQACYPPALIDYVKVDLDKVEMITQDDAYDTLEAVIAPRIKQPNTTCRISPEGLSSTKSNFVPFNKLKFSYGYDVDTRGEDAIVTVAKFFKKNDNSDVCQVTTSITMYSDQVNNQRAFDWVEDLLTNSLVALGSEFVK